MQTFSFKKAKEILLRKSNVKHQSKDSLKANHKATSLSPVKLNNNERMLFNNYQRQSKLYHKIKEKTLVIDLDETLVHSSFEYFDTPDIILPVEFEGEKSDVYVSVRPGAKEFIGELSKFYEIVIFTASMSKYAEPLMALLDEKKSVSYHLFREHCTIQEGLYIKDLSQMGKELRNIVLIDNSIVSFTFQQENGIPIKSWFDDYSDIELYKFIPILKNLSGFYDIRTEIPKFVKNNTFIWMKAIKWFKENLLNINYQADLDQVLRLEKSAMTITDSSNFTSPPNTNNTTTGKTKHNIELRHKSNSNSGKNKNHQREGNTITNNNTNNSNDFIKITNNFFYDKTSNKTEDDDANALYYCERVLTEVDLDDTLEQENNEQTYESPISIDNNNHYNSNNNNTRNSNDKERDINDNDRQLYVNTNINSNPFNTNSNPIANSKLRRSSSLNKRKTNLQKEEISKKSFLYSMKGLMLKRDSKNNLLHTSIEEKGEVPNANFYNIFKKFPKFNKTLVKAKNKNRSSIESISSFPHQKFNNPSLNYNINTSNNNYNMNANMNHGTCINYPSNKGVERSGYINLKKTPHQHYPSCSVNVNMQLTKNSNVNNNNNNQLKNSKV